MEYSVHAKTIGSSEMFERSSDESFEIWYFVTEMSDCFPECLTYSSGSYSKLVGNVRRKKYFSEEYGKLKKECFKPLYYEYKYFFLLQILIKYIKAK